MSQYMLDEETGYRYQESLREHPALKRRREMNSIYRGIIMPNGVHYKDKNTVGQTLVDIAMLGGYSDIYGAPIATAKAATNNGVEWTPETGDLVLVAFINGNWNEPVVIGQLPTMDNEKDEYLEKPHNPGATHNQGTGSNMEANAQDVATNPRRYHFRCNETDLQVDDEGNRITYVKGYEDEHVQSYRTIKIEDNDTLEVQGNGTLIIHGNLTVHVYGTATVNVDGDTTVTTPNTTVNSTGKITLNTPLTQLTGNLVVAGGISSTGSYGSTGGKIVTPGMIESTNNEVKDQVRTMEADRAIYNSHTHWAPDGGSNTSTPTPQE